MTISNLKHKESNKNASHKYYIKNKELENKKARERMRELRSRRAAEKLIAQASPPNEGTSCAELPTKQRYSRCGVDYGGYTSESERSPTPDYLCWPTPEYLRDYTWEAQMEELRQQNEKEKEKKEENEVKAMLLSSSSEESGEASEGLE